MVKNLINSAYFSTTLVGITIHIAYTSSYSLLYFRRTHRHKLHNQTYMFTCSWSALTLLKVLPQTNTFTSVFVRLSWGTGGHTREPAKPSKGHPERAWRPSLSFKLLTDVINLKLRCLRIKLQYCNLPSIVGPFNCAGLNSQTL